MKLGFLDIFSKNRHISNFIKFRPVEAELFMQTNMSKLIVAFRNFQNAPKTREDSHRKRVCFSQVIYT